MTMHLTRYLMTVVGRVRHEWGLAEWASWHISIKLLPQKGKQVIMYACTNRSCQNPPWATNLFLFLCTLFNSTRTGPSHFFGMATRMPRMGTQLTELIIFEVYPMCFPFPSLHPWEKWSGCIKNRQSSLQNVSNWGLGWCHANEGRFQTTRNDFSP